MKFGESSLPTCLVVGSGAGGLVTALTLARAGLRVTVVEEGVRKSLSAPFSLAELRSDYRNGGQTLTIGTHPINFGEASVLGGGPTINSGYYFRPASEKLRILAENWRVEELSAEDLLTDFNAIEHELEPRPMEKAGWISKESWGNASRDSGLEPQAASFIHRWDSQNQTMARRSPLDVWMSELEKLGVQFVTNCKIHKVRRLGGSWLVTGHIAGKPQVYEANYVFLCAGALETPSLLRRSGIKKNVGENLNCHLFLRAIVRFSSRINPDRCPVLAWKAANSRLTIGHSPDLPHLLALAFPEKITDLKEDFRKWSSFYVSIPSTLGRKVRPIWQTRQTAIFSRLAPDEKRGLTEAFVVLKSFLKNLGAESIYPQQPSLKFLQSVHLFGSCPMGQDFEKCAVDSWGRVPGVEGLYVNDASLIGQSIEQNPQAIVMAVARRNSRKFLKELK